MKRRSLIPLTLAVIGLSFLAPSIALADTLEPAPAPSPMKPYLSGNISRTVDQISGKKAAMANKAEGYVVQVDWRVLEPTKGNYNFQAIENQMEVARAKNKKVRLRVTAGTQAPDYAKKLGGAPIPFYDHQRQRESTLGRFWTDSYQQRWQALQRKLVERYDNDPLVAEVNVAGTGFISAEVFLTMENDKVPSTGKTNGQMAAAAGLNEQLRRKYLEQDIAFMQNTWKKTHTTLWVAPYFSFNTSKGDGMATTKEIIEATHNRKPGSTVFGHTGLGKTTLTGETHQQVLALYQWLEAQRYPFTLQTQSYDGGHGINDGVGDLSFVLTWASNHKVMAVELPAGWTKDSPALAVFPATSAKFKTNAKVTQQLYYG